MSTKYRCQRGPFRLVLQLAKDVATFIVVGLVYTGMSFEPIRSDEIEAALTEIRFNRNVRRGLTDIDRFLAREAEPAARARSQTHSNPRESR